MSLGNFDNARCRQLYEAQLRPVFENYKPVIYLDDRNEFYLSLMEQQGLLRSDRHLVDLGAGLSVFGPMCRTYGMAVTLIDDFGGGGGVELGHTNHEVPLLDLFEKKFGMKIVRENFLEHALPLPDSS